MLFSLKNVVSAQIRLHPFLYINRDPEYNPICIKFHVRIGKGFSGEKFR
jgi:hypothetical protein